MSNSDIVTISKHDDTLNIYQYMTNKSDIIFMFNNSENNNRLIEFAIKHAKSRNKEIAEFTPNNF